MGKPIKSSKQDGETKAERKFGKKLEFYSKVRDTVANLNVQKTINKKNRRSRQKKLKAYDLSVLADQLPDIKTSKEATPAKFKLNCKTRQNLVVREANQFNAVLNNAAFQSNPLDAIYQHLLSTQPADEIKPKKFGSKDKKNKVKKKKSKSASGLSTMEI